MSKLWIAYTDKRRILAIARPTSVAELLETEETIVENWYYDRPRELESFLKIHPQKEDDILKAFAYWVMQKVMGFHEEQNQYGTLKRELQNFSKSLFKKLRSLAGRIGKQIKKMIHPKKIKTIY